MCGDAALAPALIAARLLHLSTPPTHPSYPPTDARNIAQIYMGVAVGNAAWPIGVTQVGLHERSAREKIRLGAGTTVVRAGS